MPESEPGSRPPAPGDLRIVQQFINSVDIEEGVEELRTPADLAGWLDRHELAGPDIQATEADLARAIRLREGLRALALANNGVDLDSGAREALNREFRRLELFARVDAGSGVGLEPEGGPVDRALGRIVAIVVVEMFADRWSRLKACARDVCHWVFYDASRSRSGTWCSMAICGARTKMQNYYRRQHAGPAHP